MTIVMQKLDNRDVYEVTYNDQEVVGDTIVAEFENKTGGVSEYKGVNDGKFVVTVDAGFKGTDALTITGSDGGEAKARVTFG